MYKNQKVKGLGMKLSAISVAILPLLAGFAAQAAVYNVQEVAEVTTMQSTFASALNDSGTTIIHGYRHFNFPIDLTAIDFESEAIKKVLSSEQIEAALENDIDAEIHGILYQYLQRKQYLKTQSQMIFAINDTTQRIGETQPFIKLNGVTEQQPLITDSSLSNNQFLYAVNDNNIAVGVAGAEFEKVNFTPVPTPAAPEPESNIHWVPKTGAWLAAVTIERQNYLIPPVYSELGGGISFAADINEHNLVAGYGSVGLAAEAVTVLTENCKGEAVPVATCLFNHHFNPGNQPERHIEPKNFTYSQRAMLWQVQQDGTVGEPQILGFLGDKNTGEAHNKEGFLAINYFSRAAAINNEGVAAGTSLYSDSERELSSKHIYRATHATLFINDEVNAIVDPDEWQASEAIALNDNGKVIGTASKQINGQTRGKLFVYDYQSDVLAFPTGFFDSSSTIAADINNNDVVVGKAEVIMGGTTSRRYHAFMYDIQQDKFTDLNQLISCDTGYTLVDAKAINNNGEILATALAKREVRDSLGQVVLDSNGDPVLNEITVAVKLTPNATGEIEDCGEDDTEYTRKSGSSGIWWLAGLFTLLSLRRKSVM